MKLRNAKGASLRYGAKALWGTLALCALLVGGAVRPVQAQVGTLDEDKLADGYTAYTKILKDIDARAKAIDEQLAARELLSADEGKRFDELMVKAPRTAPEEGELQKLVTSGSNRRNEYLALIAKNARTADEDGKIKTFLDYSKANDTPLKTLSNVLFGKIKKEQEDAEKNYTDIANKAIADTAKKKGLKVVVRKRALVWSDDSVDITTDVLAVLNKGT